ncbi:MAG: AAA family ATPase [Nostoc sp. TH1S01]|nr:AAA family ATPase [Nostoc sp. TH1S01]
MIGTLVNIPGYSISEELYNGSRTQVYRGYREVDQQPVVVKLLKNPYPSFNELLLFRNQYTIAKNLNSPLIVQTYSLEPCQNGYALVMEDFGGISLKEWRTRETQKSLEEFLVIAIALCDILDLLYHERIIHKDIKPSNILINPETKQIKLIDFSIASLLPRETQTLVNPNVLEGTLAYISPEQTGRMNRGIDYRTDFYSLGVTFYELLTDELPFQSHDAMELVHSHIAKIPPLIHEINPDIPSFISEIVSKLMAKNAEDRYQSALGLKFDLEKCLIQLKETGEIQSFDIASRDVCDRFLIPDKLYGRETEVQTLLEAFDRVSQGATEMMLVAGFSGIGKTAVVNEVHKPILRQRGYFIKGKFDQFNRNIPFSAFVQAFRDLMGQLLTENDAQIQEYKRQILAAVGENGQVIIEVIPELERIIGQQPPAIELSGNAAQNRFNLLFQKFVRVLTTKEHPLVIFLDDLQWADSASLNLMQLLMNESANEYLLLIGAYRDNEVSAAHPLMLTLAEIIKFQGTINTVNLAPLNDFSLNLLVADTLKCSPIIAQTLTQLVYQKTQGNPFFSTQFLKSLYEDGLITFDWEGSNWQCDISAVKALAISDDVVEFMAVQLQKLPPATHNILQIAACIGNEFDLKTLALVSQESIVETATCLWNALQSGLILPQTEIYKFFVDAENQGVNQDNGEIFVYKFLHDRVQQAAYSLIPEDQKQTTHVKIGRLLWSNTPEAELEEQVFAIANQLNIGIEQFREPQERHQLSRLNFIAGKKAKASTAYNAALAYLKISIDLLPTNPWQSDYDFTLSLYNEATEASYLSGELDLMENFAQEVLQQAKAIIDTAKVYEVKIESYTIQSKFLAAIDTAMQFLRPIGIEFPPEPTDEDFFLGLQEIQALLSDKTVAELADLPEMQQMELRTALRVLVKVDIPAYLAKPELHRLLVLKKVPLSIKYGNTSASAFVYSGYGLMLSGQSNSILQGYEFGQLALQLLSKFSDHEYEARVLVVVHGFITHWKEPLAATLKPLLQAYARGLEIGDLAFACHGASVYCYHAYVAGQELTTLANELAIYSAALVKIHKQATLNYHNIYHQIVLNLIESTATPWELVGTAYDEKSTLVLNEQSIDPNSFWHFCVNKLMLCYLFQVLDLAVEYAIKAKQYSGSGYALPNISLLNWYDSLVQLALFPTASPIQQQEILQQVAENQQIMQQWANYAPMNQLHRFYLVEAEKHRVLGDKTAAIEFYDRAISQAKASGYIQEEGLANELAAKFYLAWEKKKVAAGYMQEAYYCYARWGAKAKVADLEKRYLQLLAPILQQSRSVFSTKETIVPLETMTSTIPATSSSTSVSDTLDLTTILKASQTISGEIKLEKLLSSLLSIVIENAGADKCVLMLLQDNHLLIQGSITQGKQPIVLQSLAIEDSQDIPHKLIYKVKHSQQTVVLLDASADTTLANDPYIVRQQPKSILCSPILRQGKLMGILYLENNLVAGAFTSDRIEILNLICAQAAISLENARLYESAQEYAQKLEQAFTDLQHAQLQIVQSEKMSALGNLVAGVAHEMNNPLGFISATLQQTKPNFADITEHLKLYQENLENPSHEIQNHGKEIDLYFLLEDLPKTIDSMVMACDRLKNISTSLRTFSRADKDYKVKFNLHEGIDSTILILKHRLKANQQHPAFEVITNYGDLPLVNCFPGQLNQVFMNILANAIDALEEANIGKSFAEIKAYPNRITITTSIIDHQYVKISIADNGKGMSEEVKQKIFDHLFTTKSVGKGTGLGLAIARQIVEEKHDGKITVNSVLGEGTEFVIALPITA